MSDPSLRSARMPYALGMVAVAAGYSVIRNTPSGNPRSKSKFQPCAVCTKPTRDTICFTCKPKESENVS